MHRIAGCVIALYLALVSWGSPAQAQFGFEFSRPSPRDLGAYADGSIEGTATPTPSFSVKPSQDETVKSIQSALKKTVDWSISERPLSEVVEILQKDLGIPISLDQAALADASIPTDIPITKRVQKISAHAALKSILSDHRLAWTMADEQLIITTKEEADLRMVTRIYPVIDLIQYRDKSGPFQNYLPLIQAIQNSVHPKSWKEYGIGEGEITAFAASGGIVVSQSEEVHIAIEQFVAALRATRDAQGLKGPQPGRRPAKKAPKPNRGPVPVVGGMGGFGGGGIF